MELFSDEWRVSADALHEAIRSFHVNTDMGASRYEGDDRYVTVKHRIRKDRLAVVSLGCWLSTGDGPHDYPRRLWFRTTALPEKERAQAIGKALRVFLEGAAVPALGLATYPGYEELDAGTEL